MTPSRLAIAASFALMLTACADSARPADPAARESFTATTGVYHCSGPGGTFRMVTRTRPEGLSFFLPPGFGSAHRLLAGTDGHYAAAGTEVHFRDDTADLVMPDGRYPDCVLDRRASIWEHAKLGGADFRGTGNEPGWVLEVRRQSELWLNYDYGAAELSVPILETRADPASGSTTYVGASEAGELLVTLTGASCVDTMDDETFPTRVEVRLGERTFRGCGRPLH